MSVRTFTIGAFLLCTMGAAQAQDVEHTPATYSQHRAECYVQALSLDPKRTKELAATLVKGEEEVTKLRAEMLALQERIDEAMAPYDAAVEKTLDKEQKARLAELRKGGWKACSEPCAAPGMASCAGKGDAKGGACCAGAEKGAKSTVVKPGPPAPNATVE